jgi:hypothetical protein
VEETLTLKQQPRAMPMYGFVLACCVGFSRLYHRRFLEREPVLTGILRALRLPPRRTFGRFLASLPLGVAWQVLQVQRRMRQRVWEAANVRLSEAALDTDTTVRTLFGNQMGARKRSRLVGVLKATDWNAAQRSGADGQCESRYQPEGWGKAYRFLALRDEQKPAARAADEPEQYQLSDTPEYTYRVFVTDMDGPLDNERQLVSNRDADP